MVRANKKCKKRIQAAPAVKGLNLTDISRVEREPPNPFLSLCFFLYWIRHWFVPTKRSIWVMNNEIYFGHEKSVKSLIYVSIFNSVATLRTLLLSHGLKKSLHGQTLNYRMSLRTRDPQLKVTKNVVFLTQNFGSSFKNTWTEKNYEPTLQNVESILV